MTTGTLNIGSDQNEPFFYDETFNTSGLDADASQISVDKYYNALSVQSRGPFIFLAMLLAMVGCIVNFCVLFVFLRRFPPSAIRTYMVTLAFCDFLACACGLPLEIYVAINAYVIHRDWLCKLHYVVTSWSTTSSSFTVIAIGLDRLRRVKEPTFKDEDRYRSYWAVAVVVVTASALTLPFVALAGVTERKLPAKPWERQQSLHACWVEDRYDKDKTLLLPIVYKTVLALTFLGGASLVCGSYGLIAYNIYDLTKNISQGVNDTLDHPVQKYRLRLPDIPHEVSMHEASFGLSPKRSALSLKQPDDLLHPVERLTFAERMHSRFRQRPLPSGSSPPGSRLKKISAAMPRKSSGRLKKISDAIVNFFVEPPTQKSLTRTDFISKRAETTYAFTSSSQLRHNDTLLQAHAQSGQIIPKSFPLAQVISNTLLELGWKPSTTSATLQDSAYLLDQAESRVDDTVDSVPLAAEERDSEASVLQTNPLIIIDKPGSQVDLVQEVLRSDQQLVKDSTPPVAEAPRAAETSSYRRFSGLSMMELEMLETLAHLEEIRSTATSSMMYLTLLYIFNWVPNLLARLLAAGPVYVCTPVDNCWGNITSYAVLSVYFAANLNPFFYCFGNVHFRKQVRLVFKQAREFISGGCKRQPQMQAGPQMQFIVRAPSNQPGNEEGNQAGQEGAQPDVSLPREAKLPPLSQTDRPQGVPPASADVDVQMSFK